MEFNLVDLILSIKTSNKTALVQWLFCSGSEYSSACRDIVCRWPARDCQECRLKSDCAWHKIFAQQLTVDPEALKRHQKPPLPFVFSYENLANSYDTVSTVLVKLVVVGHAIYCLEMLINGFFALIERYSDQCELGQHVSMGFQGDAHPIGDGCCIHSLENLVILSATGLIERWPWSCDRIRITFETPLRLAERGHIRRCFDVAPFTRSLFRRISSLAYYYGENESALDFKELSRQVGQITCCDNHFVYQPSWQGTNKLAGITGSAIVSGMLNDLMPFYILGSYLHSGKGSSFGLGKYALYTDQKLL